MSGATCGCCGGAVHGLIGHVDNRPSLASVAFRLGTFASFRESLLHALVRQVDLGTLSTRASGDFAVTFLELWAVIADVLTFYQERIANEAYLGTARQHESVARLVRLVDYQLRPGLAATVRLAFTLERIAAMALPIGLRVQSVPGPDERPQKFETIESLDARLELNRVPVFGRLTSYEPFAQGSTNAVLDGLADDLGTGAELLLFDAVHVERKTVVAVQRSDGEAEVTWAPPIAHGGFRGVGTRLAPAGRAFRLFGHDAPVTYVSVTPDAAAPGGFTIGVHEMQGEAFAITRSAGQPMQSLLLDRMVDDIAAGGSVLIVQEGSSAHAPAGFARLARMTAVATENATIGALPAPPATEAPPPALQRTATRIQLGMRAVMAPVVVRGVVRQYAFAVGDDAALWMLTAVDDQWGDWRSLGGNIAAFAVERLTGDRLVIVASAPDGRLWRIAQHAGDGDWDQWQAIGGEAVEAFRLARDPLDPADGTIVLVARRRDGSVAALGLDRGTAAAGAWTGLGGTVDQLFVASAGSQPLVIVARGTDGALWYRVQRSPVPFESASASSAWAAWQRRRDEHVEALELLSVAADRDDAIEVFAVDAGARLLHIARPAGDDFGSAWSSLGGPSVRQLRVRADAQGLLHAFVLSPAKMLSVVAQADSGADLVWSSSWLTLGGLAPDLFDVELNASNQLDVVAGGPAIHVMHRDASGGWSSNWSSIDTIQDEVRADLLALGRTSGGRLVVVVSDAEGALWGQVESGGGIWPLQWEPLGAPMWPIDDLRTIHVHEVTGEPLPIRTLRHPATIEGARVYAKLIDVEAVPSKRALVLDDGGGPPLLATVSSAAPVDLDLDGSPDHLEIGLAASLGRALDGRTTMMYGNVALASHGERVRPDTLGDGDAASAFQRFPLHKHPLTILAGRRGFDSSLEVLVDGVRWNEVPTLYGQPATAQVYVTRLRDDGSTIVQFGNGAHGARPPSGAGNVVARYRQGSGLEGRVRAGTLTNLLDRPVGVRAVMNPLPAEGGADPERADDARRTAPTTVRTFDRAVSLRDIEDLAVSSGEIAKASGAIVWDGDSQAVHLTVAAAGGAVPGADVVSRLAARVDARRDPNRALLIAPFVPVPVEIAATLRIEPTHVASVVAARARAAVIGALSFEAMAFGQSLHLSDVHAILQAVEGVQSVDVDVLQLEGYEQMSSAELAARGATSDPLQAHVRIFGARPLTPPARGALPAEQVLLESPDANLRLAIIGGLAD